MGLLFHDGFDNYNTLSQKYTVNGSPTIDGTGGRFLGGALTVTANNRYVRAALTAGDVFIANVAFKVTTLPSASTRPFDIIMFLDGGSAQVALRVYDTGAVKLERLSGSGFINQTGTVLATSSGALLTVGNWYAFEIKLTIANSGSCVVKQDGTTIINFSGDTQATGSAIADTFLIGWAQDTGTGSAQWDDVIIMDDAGSFMNDFIGDKRIYTLFPTAEGNYSAWTPSTGTDNSALVDETPPNEDTDYVMSDNPTDKDTYVMQDIPTGVTGIEAVVVNIRARKDDAGTRTLKAKVRSNGVDQDGANFNLSSGYVNYSTPFYVDPGSSPVDPWTTAAVNAMEAGQEVVV